MQWVKSGIENPSKLAVVAGMKKTNDYAEQTKSRTLTKKI